MQALEQMRYESEQVIRIFLNQIFLLILHPPSPQDGQFRAELYILSWKTYFKPLVTHIQLRKYHFSIKNQKKFLGKIVPMVRQFWGRKTLRW